MIQFSISVRNVEPYKIVCYYGAWSVYRTEPFSFGVGDIDPFSCTHLIYSFAGLDPDSLTIISLDVEEDIVKGKSHYFVVLPCLLLYMICKFCSAQAWRNAGRSMLSRRGTIPI